jgi:hypothetical protein
MFMQNSSSLACTQTDLDNFFTIYEENLRIFQENLKRIQKILNLSMKFYTQPSKTCSCKI